MPKPNYVHARREKERVRKARQQEKLQRRSGRQFESTSGAPQADQPATTIESDNAAQPPQPQSEK
jgi:hypothetical protein